MKKPNPEYRIHLQVIRMSPSEFQGLKHWDL